MPSAIRAIFAKLRRNSLRIAKRQWDAWLLTGLALALRLPAVGFSPRMAWARPDEHIFAGRALLMFGDVMDPKWASEGWPEGFFFITHFMQRALLWWYGVRFGREVNLGCVYAFDPNALYVPVRLVSVLLGALTIPFVMMLARAATPRDFSPIAKRIAPTLAGAFMAFNYLHARDSRFAVSDVTLSFFITAAFALGARALVRDRWRDYAGAGLAMGLATAVKWAALGVYPAFALLFAVRVLLPKRRGVVLGLLRTGLAIACFGAGFLILCPHFLDNPTVYIDGLKGQSIRFGWHQTYDPYSSPLVIGSEYYPRVSLPIAFGLPVLGLAIAGLLYGVRAKTAALFSLVACAGIFFVAILARVTLTYSRYSMPIFFALCVCAAVVAAVLIAGLGRMVSATRAQWVAVGIAALLCVVPIGRTISFMRISLAGDTRDMAADWLNAHMKPDQRFVALGYCTLHALPQNVIQACGATLPDALRPAIPPHEGENGSIDALIAKGRPGWTSILDLTLRLYAPHAPVESVDWIAVSQPIVECGRRAPAAPDTVPTGRCFVPRARFSPGRPTCDAVYETVDYLYVPFAGFDGVTHAGSEITILENVCKTRGVDGARGG